ncbi:hypothetical protein DFJ74DRAFT_703980 [Hyaloraphidium curvatum]|nr:hypothetical protein DFJ74DRAFT_703980 [Hyaloraphidium curvatum]
MPRLLQIHQLESERTSLEEEEDAMDKAIKNATTEINKLAESTHGDTAALQAKYIGLFETYKVLERDYAKLKKKYELSEQQKREELSSKFESTIWEIKSKMEEESDDRSQTLDEAEVG